MYGHFVWDLGKEAANIRKHGVDFATAARAFQDPARRLFHDARHTAAEARLFCLGQVDGCVLTVRFTHRAGRIRIYGAGYWRKGRRYYEQAQA